MIGHHPHAHVVEVGLPGRRPRGAAPVGLAGHLLGGGDDGVDLVDLVHSGLVLHDEGEALQAGAGVDRRAVEFAYQFEVVASALAADELVEDEIPDLQKAVPLRIGRGAAVGAVVAAAVVVDLAARAGRTGLTGGPGDLLEG